MASNNRSFFEKLMSYWTKHEYDKFMSYIDTHINWNIHGDNPWKGSYHNWDGIKKLSADYHSWQKGKPTSKILSLVVEGSNAAAYLVDECTGKDGKKYNVEYCFVLTASPDYKKIVKVENFIDSKQLLNLYNQAHGMRKTA